MADLLRFVENSGFCHKASTAVHRHAAGKAMHATVPLA